MSLSANRSNDGHGREQMRGIMVGMGNVSVVITSYNQNEMIREAVDSVRRQKLRPDAIIVVDDGSTDPASVQVLDELEQADDITVVRQGNAGPSAARNVGIRAARTDCVTVLDGDDRLLPTFLATTVGLLDGDASAVATSGWLRTFGVLDAVVKPTGGTIADFLPRNACPATFTFRRTVWETCGGYDESMRSGFEDWDFCLSLLTAAATAADTTATGQEPRIAIAPEPLIEYRTAPATPNITSMTTRLETMRYLIDKHHAAYAAHLTDALLGIEATSIARLNLWERTVREHPALLENQPDSRAFMASPTYGDGGMAAAVRLRSMA